MAADEKMRVGPMTQPVQAQQPLWRRYEEPDDRGLIDDVCEEVRLLAERGPEDPGQTIALAVAGAEAAEGLAAALEDPWALYTPQQVAVTASALFTQITTAGTALEKLDRLLDVMAERGDITEPDYDGVGEAERLCTAQSTLGAAGQEAAGAIDVRACDGGGGHPHLHALHRGDAYQHPRDSHQLADLLGDSTKLVPGCRPPAEAVCAARDYTDGCGCHVELTDRDGIVWEFHRSDGTWYFMPLADVTPNGRPLDGRKLSMTEALPHPQHLALLVQQTLAAAV
ncbi:hypothetical protein [Streptomyces sp. MA15]|uniref:hypothetical protein n=1 Tax=Streptomyces sp. MA15 TaxID=3055061 RepID=UPI0025B066E8|nr:hypothetical protein [Streptomyces sp. MA15]MDN3271445.1 hypothetical protein [Streptomyces sp. MA15]